jgi:sec-independent protein translocase protein TatA
MKLAIIGSIGPTELLIVLAIVVIVFGGKKIPELGESIGKGIRNFKKSMNTDADETKQVAQDNGTSNDAQTSNKSAEGNKVL